MSDESTKRPITSQLGFMIPKGDTVLVCDSKGYLHIHKLKENRFFNADEIVKPGQAERQTFIATEAWKANWSGFRSMMSLLELESNDYMVIKTDESEWPYIVFCTLPPGVTKVEE